MTDGSNQLVIATRMGQALRMEENQVRSMGRNSHGVKGIALRDNDEVISLARVREGASVLTVSEQGFGKRTPLEEYRLQGRGGFGIRNYPVKETGNPVCGIKVVDEDDDIILISTEGIIIRVPASEIRMCGRISKGVKVMKVSDGNTVVTFTRAEHESPEEPDSDSGESSPKQEEFSSDSSEEVTI